MTLTFQQQVTAFMEANGFVWYKRMDLWAHNDDTGPILDSMTSDQAAFMYRQTLIARRDELAKVQLEYGHYLAQTFVNGQARTIEERIADLDQLIKESGE